MARKKIREFQSKRLLRTYAKKLAGLELPLKMVQVNHETDWKALTTSEPWLTDTKLVVKPDMLFGKRGKNDLVGLRLDLNEAMVFIQERLGRKLTIDSMTGSVTTFIVEPYIEHEVEYYMCIQSERLGNQISFSDFGGIEIEENWDRVKSTFIATGVELTERTIAPLINQIPVELRQKLFTFIKVCYQVFIELDFTMMEMNPFTLDENSNPVPLDMRGQLDDTSLFRNVKVWGDIDFPQPFGKSMAALEERVSEMDENTGASLKLSILNPTGHIWTMVAGGGASVIYADTVGDLGCADELGNYAEYSGAPKEQETYKFASAIIECITSVSDRKAKALIIGGAIANFTNVATTFNGIIRAMREKEMQLKAANVRVYVRRGGPNYKIGLENMIKLGADIGIPFEVYGPEASMTGICSSAINYIKSTS